MSTDTVDVICIGLATRDTIAQVPEHPPADGRVVAMDLQRAGGGPAATAAVALARLGHRVAFVGAVGDDAAGDEIRASLTEEGVSVTDITVVTGARSPESLILVASVAATRSITAYPGTAGPPRLSVSSIARCAAARWVHVDHVGYGVMKVLVPSIMGTGVRLSVDGGNPIDDLELRGVTLYAPTEHALRARYEGASLDASIKAALAEGASTVVATLGGHGSCAATRDRGAFRVPAYETALTSTLGAGDVYHGALLAGLLEDRSLEEAMERANVAAALSCRNLDGRSAIPARAELDEACESLA
ncbi:sugar kinase [soil metagenome]|jgi:sugar/nucleoside kinase (ribokinase family)|nr:hypothetical protein [Chloroflexota bacterium]